MARTSTCNCNNNNHFEGEEEEYDQRFYYGCKKENAFARVSAVIFDLDGTIIDTEKVTGDVLKEILERRYGKVWEWEKEKKRLGSMHKVAVLSIVEDYGLPCTPQDLSDQMMQMYIDRWPKAKALPGANRLIKHLNKLGVPTALASNSIHSNIELKLSYQKGWKEAFCVILGSNDVKEGKPAPDLFLEAAKRMHVEPSSCVVIEDSVVGVTAAKAAGMWVVAVPSLISQVAKYSAADSVLHSLLEFQPEEWGLPAFQDVLENVAPIEPFQVEGIVSGNEYDEDGMVLLTPANGDNSIDELADQIYGTFTGLATVGNHGSVKAMLSIKWNMEMGVLKRTLGVKLLSDINEDLREQLLRMSVDGYIHQ